LWGYGLITWYDGGGEGGGGGGFKKSAYVGEGGGWKGVIWNRGGGKCKMSSCAESEVENWGGTASYGGYFARRNVSGKNKKNNKKKGRQGKIVKLSKEEARIGAYGELVAGRRGLFKDSKKRMQCGGLPLGMTEHIRLNQGGLPFRKW